MSVFIWEFEITSFLFTNNPRSERVHLHTFCKFSSVWPSHIVTFPWYLCKLAHCNFQMFLWWMQQCLCWHPVCSGTTLSTTVLLLLESRRHDHNHNECSKQMYSDKSDLALRVIVYTYRKPSSSLQHSSEIIWRWHMCICWYIIK